MAMHRVLVTDKLADEGLAQLRAEPGIEVVVNTSWPLTQRDCVRSIPGRRARIAIPLSGHSQKTIRCDA